MLVTSSAQSVPDAATAGGAETTPCAPKPVHGTGITHPKALLGHRWSRPPRRLAGPHGRHRGKYGNSVCIRQQGVPVDKKGSDVHTRI